MPRFADYGTGIGLIAVNQKIRDDWKEHDDRLNVAGSFDNPENDLPGSVSRLLVRDQAHAGYLAESVKRVIESYKRHIEQRGPTRGRIPGTAFPPILETLEKLAKSDRQPKHLTSDTMGDWISAHPSAGGAVPKGSDRVRVVPAAAVKPASNDDSREVFDEVHQQIGDIRFAIPHLIIRTVYHDRDKMRFAIRMHKRLVVEGAEAPTRAEAWADFATKVESLRDSLKGQTAENSSPTQIALAWLLGVPIIDGLPDEFAYIRQRGGELNDAPARARNEKVLAAHTPAADSDTSLVAGPDNANNVEGVPLVQLGTLTETAAPAQTDPKPARKPRKPKKSE